MKPQGPSAGRRTRQREVIRGVIEASERPVSVAELHAKAREEWPTLSIATVYRTLNLLLEERSIVAVEVPGEGTRYERAGLHHHHHFHCQSCGRTFDLEGCPTRAIEGLAPAGFKVESHDVTLFGRCNVCST